MTIETIIEKVLSESPFLDKTINKALKRLKALLPNVAFSKTSNFAIIGKYQNEDLITIDFDSENDDWTDNKDVDVFDINVDYDDVSNFTHEPGFDDWLDNYEKEFKALNAAIKAKDDAKIKQAIENLF